VKTELDATGRRIVGVLIEKEATTPNLYPLTSNAVVSGASQKSNRHPVHNYQSFEIEGALRGLMVTDWVTQVTGAGSRTAKWRHRAEERLDCRGAELAVMAELLLRGPQHPGELRARASRMVPIADLETLERLLANLEAKGLVKRLERQPGERAARVDHRLYSEGEGELLPGDQPEESFSPTVSEPTPTPTPPASAELRAETADESLAERVAHLEEAVRDLRERLSQLEDA
jgi:uncharacterized protein